MYIHTYYVCVRDLYNYNDINVVTTRTKLGTLIDDQRHEYGVRRRCTTWAEDFGDVTVRLRVDR